MNVDVVEVAEEFWTLAEVSPTYPCRLEEVIFWALPIELRFVPNLQISQVEKEIQRYNPQFRLAEVNRPLRGCVVAFRGQGTIFVDSNDLEDEKQVTIGHEGSHFMLDYLKPRKQAIELFGESILDVLDGVREPTVAERVHAVLERVPLGVMAHLMERPEEGVPSTLVLDVENRADQVTLEILAPRRRVLGEFRSHMIVGTTYKDRHKTLMALLVDHYRLPPGIAQLYATHLLQLEGGPSILDWLRGTIY